MLRWRLISAAVIITALVGVVLLDANNPLLGVAGLWLLPIGLLVAMAGAEEVLDLLRSKNHRPVAWTVYLGTLAVFLAACTPIIFQMIGATYPKDCPLGIFGLILTTMAGCVGLCFLGEIMRYKEPDGVIVNVALAVFVIAYIGLLSGFIVSLRLFHDAQWGMAALLSLIIVVKFSDAGAYAVGHAIGRHKMAPRLSPGKTIEGAIGGIVTACLASWLVFTFLVPSIVTDAKPAPWWGSVLYGLVVALAGMLGDLAESLLKRDMNRKDSSSWLPGLGGVLDVLDSILAAAPPAYLCWVIGLVGPR